MSFAYILLLAVLQGLTEFLPVSSSGHLALAPKLLEVADQGLLMDVAMHVGTLCAVLVYYRRDVMQMVCAVWRFLRRAERAEDIMHRNLAFFIVLATIPAVVFGFILHVTEPDGLRALGVIIFTTLFFGVLMGIADRIGAKDKTIADIRLRHALVIGFAQMCALIPGTSRSGVTMTAARFMGFARVDAARFSFLLGIPATAAAGTLGFLEMLQSGDPQLLHDAALGMVFSFLAGLAAIHFMMRWLSRYGLLPFAVYRVFLGLGLIAYSVYQL